MKHDALVIGSGPNGLAAAIALVSEGYSVRLIEGAPRLGGGLRCHRELESDFLHDHCAAVHPMGILSPFFSQLELESCGLTWCQSDVSVAHPLLDGPAAIVTRDLERTSERLGPVDARRWRALLAGFVRAGRPLFQQLMAPPTLFPQAPFQMLRFAWHGLRPAQARAEALFEGASARALFAGLAGHSILPLDRAPSSAVGLIFALAGHLVDWPCVQGGSDMLAQALLRKFVSLGGEVQTDCWVGKHSELPPHRVALYDVSPRALASIAEDVLPAGYLRRLLRYRYGPGTFKLDYTLDGPIPWTDPIVAQASTVHVGASVDEIALSEKKAFAGETAEAPFLIVCQQSALDATRAPAGKHTGYAYCHVPGASDVDMSERIERQIERFAPGFRDLIRARKVTTPAQLEGQNPNFVGGAVAGGVADLGQLFTRPVARLNPYSTPNPRLFICSASSPPGGGVHGMCGYYAAQGALRALKSGRA